MAVVGGLSSEGKKKKRKTARGQRSVYFDIEPEERRTRFKVGRIFPETDGQTETAGVERDERGGRPYGGKQQTHLI